MNAKRRAASLLLGVILAACVGTPTPPTPGPSPITTPGPTSPPESATPPSAVPTLTAPSPSPPGPTSSPTGAAQLPGSSPVPAALPIHDGTVSMAPGPDGGLYILVADTSGPGSRSVLTLLDVQGRPRAGWPIALVGWGCGGWAESPPLAAGDGSIRLVCSVSAGPGEPEHSRAFAFDPKGRSMVGWPVDLPDEILRWLSRVVDDRLVVVARGTREANPATGESSGALRLLSVAADGTLRVGRRYEKPDTDQDNWSPQIGPDGIAYQQACFDDRTEIMAFDLDGARAGWPVRVDSCVSGVVFGPPGRLYVIECTSHPQTTRTLVFDLDGRALPFGSAALPIEAQSTWSGAGPGEPAVVVASDGAAFLLSDAGYQTTVYGLDPSGRVMAGWPYHATDGLQWQGECSGMVTGCGVSLSTSAVGPGDVLYLPQAGRRLVAIGPDGKVRAGWPVVLTRPGAEFWSVVVGSDGTAYALAIEPEAGDRTSSTILAIAPDGTVRYRTTVVDP